MWQDVQALKSPDAKRKKKDRAEEKAARIENILRLEIAKDKKKADTPVEVYLSFHVPMICMLTWYYYTLKQVYVLTAFDMDVFWCVGTLSALFFQVYYYIPYHKCIYVLKAFDCMCIWCVYACTL